MTASDYRRFICDACGYIYDEAKGDPDSGLAAGTRFEDIPDDWQCPLCGLTKTDLRALPEPVAPVASKVATKATRSSGGKGSAEHVVIVGAGIAGWSVAEAIREKDHEVPILLITACEGISYPKPALSTALASGKSIDDLAESDALSKAAQLNLDVLTRTRVLKIDAQRKRLATPKGGIRYGRLILALGAHQRELPISGSAADTILRVNDLAAYRALRQRLDSGVKHVTILGAGLIGCEFAEDLSAGGYKVTVVDPTDQPLARLLPPDTAAELRRRLKQKGVDWRFQATVDHLEHVDGCLHAHLSTGEILNTDLVLSAAGLVPNTQLAEKAKLEIDRGIVTDRSMRTSIDDVYAIGDCAAVEGQVFAYIEPIRRQAATIAAALAGEEQPFDLKPPLVRVKTPSFPLTVCPPKDDGVALVMYADGDESRLDYRAGDRTVGFVLSGEQAQRGASLYRELFC